MLSVCPDTACSSFCIETDLFVLDTHGKEMVVMWSLNLKAKRQKWSTEDDSFNAVIKIFTDWDSKGKFTMTFD